MSKVYINTGGGFGDCLNQILTGPFTFAQAIKDAYPDTYIHAVFCSVNLNTGGILDHHPAYDEVTVVKPEDNYNFIEKLKSEGYEGWSSRNLIPNPHKIYLTQEEEAAVQKIVNLGKYIVVHPFDSAGTGFNTNPIYQYIINQIITDGYYVVQVGGDWVHTPSGRLHKEKFDFAHEKFIDLVNVFNVRQVFRLIEESSKFIGTSSVWTVASTLIGVPSLMICSNKLMICSNKLQNEGLRETLMNKHGLLGEVINDDLPNKIDGFIKHPHGRKRSLAWNGQEFILQTYPMYISTHGTKMSRLYVAISGFYVGADVWTLRMLKQQTDKDFTLVFIDPGWDETVAKRLQKFEQKTGIPTIRVPYCFPSGSRFFDWGQWNTPFLLAESENDFVFRLQSWRLMPSNFIADIKKANRSMGFVRDVRGFSVSECLDFIASKKYTSFTESGDDRQHSDFYVCYGDWCLNVRDMMEINGIDEPATTIFHSEDGEMEVRWDVAIREKVIKPALSVNGLIYLGLGTSRQELVYALDIESTTHKDQLSAKCPTPCRRCREYRSLLITEINPIIPDMDDIIDLGFVNEKHWLYCKRCDVPLPYMRQFLGNPEKPDPKRHFNNHRATIGLIGRWGRNLKTAREKALNLSMDKRIEYVVNSYTDPDVLK